MSIYIPGISVSCCLDCPCAEWQKIEDDDIMWICSAVVPSRRIKYKFLYDRQAWCPLLEVPPHGRLVDVSKLPFNEVRLDEYGDWWMNVEDIETAPTIIPADGADKERSK